MTFVYFVIVIFVLVTVHEFGHFIAGRIFGMHVPVFSVGMGRRLFGWNRYNGFTLGPLHPDTEIKLGEHTDYRLSLLPIGGYAKIDGMIDETQTEALSSEVQPWEFRAKPWWQKSIVISAGVIMNILLAWSIFTALTYSSGKDIMNTTKIGYVETSSVSYKLGLRPGDQVLKVNNDPVHNWDDVELKAIRDNIGRDYTMTLDRAGQPYTVTYRTADVGKLEKPEDLSRAFGLVPEGYGPPRIQSVVAANPAAHAGLQAGDIVTAVNGEQIVNVFSLIDHIKSHPNQQITINWLRDKQPMSAQVTPTAEGQIGVQLEESEYTGPKQHIDYSIGEAIGQGWKNMGTVISLTGRQVKMIFAGQMSPKNAVGGPLKIAQMASQSAANGVFSFLNFMALLSISLALLNILPIPALDGGHLIIILIEAAVGHELSQRFKLNFQKVGVALLLSLMVFMVFNDIRGL